MSKLYLITGFLGAGKTTFLKNFIRELSNYRLHIIVNEFGKEGIDGQLLKDIGAEVDEINNGSIFCSCRLDKFEEVLMQALLGKPDVILVEASGLSNPVNVRKILAQSDKFQDIEYMGSICLIDAVRFLKVYETATVVKKQVGISDLMILNKTDLASSTQLEETKQILRQHRPDVPVYETVFGKIEKEWLEQISQPVLKPEEPEIQHMDITLRKYLIDLNDTFTYYSFQKFVEMFIEDTYRIKGFVRLEGTTYLVDCVGNLFKAQPYDKPAEPLNELVVLSGNGLPARKSIKEAIKWYPNDVKKLHTD